MRSSSGLLWLVGIGVILGVLLHHRILRWKNRWGMARIRQRGQAGEIRAERWLRHNGFHIESEQATHSGQFRLDGALVTFDVRADFIVRNPEGRRAVVEVKTGDAANPRAALTRRQILEYAAIYGVNDVYLFDGTNERLMHLEFSSPPVVAAGEDRSSSLRDVLIGVVIGVVLIKLLG